MEQHRRSGSHILLDKSALSRNIRFLRGLCGEAVFSSVVKGNAYGHGIESFVPLAEDCGVRHFSAFSAREAERVYRSMTADSHVMIMGFVEDGDLEWAVRKGISFYVFTVERLVAALRAARSAGRPALVHLELETGMHRLGLERDELDTVIRLVLGNPEQVTVAGVSTHLAGAESVANYVRVSDQLTRFGELCGRLREAGVSFRVRHAASSAGLLMYPESALDLVRVGIAQYGLWPTMEVKMHYLLSRQRQSVRQVRDPLHRVLTWRSCIMSVKDVAAGKFVGYGTAYQTTRRERIASIPTGYYDGFPRLLSNRGHVLVRGRRAPVLGTVNMSMMLVDVTHIPDVGPGDEVIIIGKQGRRTVSVASFSDFSDVMNYEALVRLPSDLPRVVLPGVRSANGMRRRITDDRSDDES